MAASRWSRLEVQMLILVAVTAATVARVSCNGTIANAAVYEMMDDPRSASKSWGVFVAKEFIDWGKVIIVEVLRLNRTGSKLRGDVAQPTKDKGELFPNIPREATSRAYETCEEASIRTERNRQHYPTTSSCENLYGDVDGERFAASTTQFAAIETAKHAKLWGDKMVETVRHIMSKSKSAYAINKALLLENSLIKRLKGQQVESKIQENDFPKQKVQKNVKLNLEIGKDKAAKHQEETVEEENKIEIHNAQHAKETATNNKKKKVFKEQEVSEKSKELGVQACFEFVKEKAKEGHDQCCYI